MQKGVTIIANDTDAASSAMQHLTLHDVAQEQVQPMLSPLATNAESMCGKRFKTCRQRRQGVSTSELAQLKKHLLYRRVERLLQSKLVATQVAHCQDTSTDS